MSWVIPSPGSPLGDLTIDLVLDEYDGPLLFTARDVLNHAFLAVVVERNPEGDTFMYVPVSEERLGSVLTGLISLHDGFSEPESPVAFAFQTGTAGGTVTQIAISDIAEDWFPAVGEYLREQMNTAPRYSPEWLAALARRQSRPLSALELNPSVGIPRTEFPMGRTGELMVQFQGLAEALASDTEVIPNETILDATYSVLQISAASYVIVIAPLVGESRLTYGPSIATKRIAQLLSSAEAGTESFATEIGTLTRRSLSHLRDFLNTLSEAETGITLTNARPAGEISSSVLNLAGVRTSLDLLRARSELRGERLHVRGHLIAINHVRGTFGIEEERPSGKRKKPRRYSGAFDGVLLREIDGLATGRSIVYNFTIVTEIDRAEFSDAVERKRYRMVAIDRVTPDELVADT